MVCLGLVARGRGTWGVPLRDGSLREKGVGGDPFFPSVRFIPAKGHPMHLALFDQVVALGLIAGQVPLLQLPTPIATGRTGEPEPPSERNGRIIVQDAHTLFAASSSSFMFCIW